MSFHFVKQRDSMQCGIACMAMICRFYGKQIDITHIEKICHATTEGVSMRAIVDAANTLGFDSTVYSMDIIALYNVILPCILYWNQNHFVVLYEISKNGRSFKIADPSKGLTTYNRKEIESHWISSMTDGEPSGTVMQLIPQKEFYKDTYHKVAEKRSFHFLFGYLKQYKKYFAQIIIGLTLGCVLLLILPFLTQSIVDLGIRNKDIGIIWLILIGELMIVIGRTATDFIRRWLLLHISMRINISLVSDFFIKLLKLPMSFFDTKLMGDLIQRIGDHSRVQSFLTTQTLSIMFSSLSFIVFGIVLSIYSTWIFLIFIVGSLIYGFWISSFLKKRKYLDYELFEKQAINQNKTYQFITSMQEIKLQDCEQRRRWEWEDTQADLFAIQMKSMKLQQTQEAGSIFINELKNILITVFAATAVINGQITLGAMLAVQYIIGQLNSPVEQFMAFIYSLQDVKISLERINEIHEGKNEETDDNQISEFRDKKLSN